MQRSSILNGAGLAPATRISAMAPPHPQTTSAGSPSPNYRDSATPDNCRSHGDPPLEPLPSARRLLRNSSRHSGESRNPVRPPLPQETLACPLRHSRDGGNPPFTEPGGWWDSCDHPSSDRFLQKSHWERIRVRGRARRLSGSGPLSHGERIGVRGAPRVPGSAPISHGERIRVRGRARRLPGSGPRSHRRLLRIPSVIPATAGIHSSLNLGAGGIPATILRPTDSCRGLHRERIGVRGRARRLPGSGPLSHGERVGERGARRLSGSGPLSHGRPLHKPRGGADHGASPGG